MNRPPLEVADIVRCAGQSFVERSRKWINGQHEKVLLAITRCRTAALGGHRDQCSDCGHTAISYNSCRNRHCPKCQGNARLRWLQARARELLHSSYVHVVFTVPRELAPLALQNKRLLYNLLFHASAATLLEIARDPRHLGAEIGFFSVLHTWDQRLQHHPHVHCVLAAGGITPDHSRWISSRRSFFLPIKVLSRVFRGKFIGGLKTAFHAGALQQPIPCRLRESAFVLDGLLEHDTELDPRVCYTDTHGYTEVVMATAALLGYDLAPRIKGLRHQTLYKIDRGLTYPYLDPILSGTVKVHLIRDSWDAVVRLIASLKTRIVSPSLMLQRLGSYARQNSMHQALAEIGRVEKTIHILRTLDSEDYRRRMGRELNKGESSHDLSRFLCFGKEGALRGREFEDQLHTFSYLALLHNAVVAWNTLQIGSIIEELRREGENVEEADLALTSPLLRRHLNPFGRYHFDLERLRRES